MSITVPHNFKPRFYQLPVLKALDSGIKRAIAVWHRRAGKEKTFINYVVKEAVKRVGSYYYLFPTYSQAKKVVWDGRDKDGFAFLDHIPAQLVKSKHSQDLKITLVNGSIIQLIGTDNIDSVVGTNPVGCVFSEYALQNPVAWDFLRPILRENGGWAIFDYTPRGRNHGFTLYQMAKGNPDWFVSLLTIDDTGVLSLEDIEAERREGMDEDLIQQEYYCSFEGARQGTYYGKQMRDAELAGRIASIPYDTAIGVETWWDIGVGDSTAIWFTQTVGKEVHVIDYLEASGESIQFYAKALQAKPYSYVSHNGPHDLEAREFGNSGPDGKPMSRVASAKAHGIDFKLVPNQGIEDGIEVARAFIAKCWFDRVKCEKGINALLSYHKEYDEKKKVFQSYPCHDWSSHGADGFRYLAVGHRMTKAEAKAKPAKQPVLQQHGWMG